MHREYLELQNITFATDPNKKSCNHHRGHRGRATL